MELARFLSLKPEEREKMIMDMREEHEKREGSQVQADPDLPATAQQSDIPTPRQQLPSKAIEQVPNVYVSG